MLASVGHYVADVRHVKSGAWLHCDDERVFEVTEREVVEKRQSSAYILLYRILSSV